MTKKTGKVYLVGAGPGDESLITVRGLELIKQADAIVYDRLAGEGLLKHRKDGCKLVYVGKSPAGHALRQEGINQLLVDLAKDGLMVVRLKGGDSFVFGRGGEEALELIAHSIPFEVIPGVTSSLAGPAVAGIPVTHRGVSTSFAVITGHEDPTKGRTDVDWEKIATSVGTLVVLMGVGNLPTIAKSVMAGGRSPDTPVALVRYATTDRQEVLVSTLENVVQDVADKGMKSPSIIIIGEVVRLREQLASQKTLPLEGKRVLITRPELQTEEFAELLRSKGATPVSFPLIKIVPTEDTKPMEDALASLESYDWLFLTSANGVRTVAPYLKPIITAAGGGMKLNLKVAAVGPRTAQVCRELGLQVDFIPKEYSVDAIAREFPDDPKGKRMLLLRAKEANLTLPASLKESGAEVEEITIYRAEPVATDGDKLRALFTEDQVDIVTLMSSSTVRALAALLGDDAAQILEKADVASLGHMTSDTYKQIIGRAPEIQASVYTMQGLIQAIIDNIER